MKKGIVVDIPFNIDLSRYQIPGSLIQYVFRSSFAKAQTKEWITRRLQLAMKYSINSLLHQTNSNFIGILRCTKETEPIIQEALKEYPKLPKHIRFTAEAEDIIEEQMKKNDFLYRVVIDSDNMYARTFIDQIAHFNPMKETKSLVCQEGYLYEERYGLIASIIHPMPSFYAAIYDAETYPSLYQKRLFEDHFQALNYPYEVLPGKNYLITVHEQNLSNKFIDIFNTYGGVLLTREEENEFFKTWHLQ